jgi:hypothetical protein
MTVAELIEQLKQIQDQEQQAALTDGGAYFEVETVNTHTGEIRFNKVY